MRLAYQLLLGREPANENVITSLANFRDIWELRNLFLLGKEHEVHERILRVAELIYADEAVVRKSTESFDALISIDPQLETRIHGLIHEDAQSAESTQHQKYSTFHAQRFFDQVRSVVAVRQKMLTEVAHPRVLDVGSSPVTLMYRQIAPEIELCTANLPSSAPAEEGAQQFGATRNYYIDLELEPLSECYPELIEKPFDIVVFCEVIEHVRATPEEMLTDLFKIIRPGGFLIMSTPNAMSASALTKLVSGKKADLVYKRREWAAGRRPRHLHVREYTTSEIRNALTAGGFSILAHALKNYYSEAKKNITTAKFVSAGDAQIVIARK